MLAVLGLLAGTWYFWSSRREAGRQKALGRLSGRGIEGLVVIGYGFYNYMYQYQNGLGVTGLSRDVPWGLYIAQLTFLVGVAASAVMVVLPYYLHHYKQFARLTILGEFLGAGCVNEGTGIVDVRPDGDGVKRAIEQALADAEISPDQVALIVDTNYGDHGVRSAKRYTHFSLLKSLEAGFGLPCLNHACDKDVDVMSDLFGRGRDSR